MDDKKEEKKEESKPMDSGEGNKPKSPKVIEELRVENERMETNLEKRQELLTREEEILAHKQMDGKADAGQKKEEEKPLTPIEYAEAMQRGEVDPMKEDGY